MGSNSIGWALLSGVNGKPTGIIDAGVRIFEKAVQDKSPTPKNVNRRNARLARRVTQRRARRKRKMLSFLISKNFLPNELLNNNQPESILNKLGDPYELRSKALDEELSAYELGRVFLHLAQRRGFLSNKKTLLGDMVNDPDVEAILQEDENTIESGEEGQFKVDISILRNEIFDSGSRTLGEYLYKFRAGKSKRNRLHEGGRLRTDRRMYKEELDAIVAAQQEYHAALSSAVIERLNEIIFFQRSLKLRSDRVGKCSLEPVKNRSRMGRLEAQRFRYLQDINNLTYLDVYQNAEMSVDETDRVKLINLFETTENPTFAKIKSTLGLSRSTELNLERGTKKLKGNTTACKIRKVYSKWDKLSYAQQIELVEDLTTIQKKSVLKKRLINYWKFDVDLAVALCMIELEPGHSSHSLKAIHRILPFLEAGQIYSDARKSAGYDYEKRQKDVLEKLGLPPETSNPIVNKGLSELRRVVNAVIAEYGKPDIIRIEMARDLEMNTKRYKQYIKQQKANTKANDEAVEAYKEVARTNPHLRLGEYPSHEEKLRYRLLKDQDFRCAYSNETINKSSVFSAEIEIDHIVPYSWSLDDSYQNKVVCYANENRYKSQRTPVDAFGGNAEKWEQITAAISRWPKQLKSKAARFYLTSDQVDNPDFAASQLNDTRYICKIALDYVGQLGGDVNATKGFIVSWLRHQWGLNRILGLNSEKDRTDHRHHVIDAIVIASIDRGFHQKLAKIAREVEQKRPELNIRDLVVDPPWVMLTKNTEDKVSQIIVSHQVHRKVSGSLHEDTGLGFKDGIGLVTRKSLDSSITSKQLRNIVDPTVRNQVQRHLKKYGDTVKDAFAEGITVFHKDDKTPIKRVRVLQSKTTLSKLQNSKFGVKDKKNDFFKWMTFGNTHHVEILKEKSNGKIMGKFVTMMEAARRVRGVKGNIQPLIKTDHGQEWEFLFALHINDVVRLTNSGEQKFFRVQKLEETGNRVIMRRHTAATLKDNDEMIRLSLNRSAFEKYEPQLLRVNAIGKILP